MAPLRAWTRVAFCFVVIQTWHSACIVDAEDCAQQDVCPSAGTVLLQHGTRVQQLVGEGEELSTATAKRAVHEARVSTAIKVWLPSWIMVFSVVVILAALFTSMSGYCWHKEQRGCGFMCSGFLGVIFILLAVALVVFKVYLMRLAGPEPAGPVDQDAPKTNMVVDTVVPFNAGDINTPGPVQTAYVEGMQSALDQQAGVAGMLTVLSVQASPIALMLIEHQHNTAQRADNRVSLSYTIEEKNGETKSGKEIHPRVPRVKAGDLEDGIRAAAKKQAERKGPVPQLLKNVADGSASAAARSAVEIKVDASFRCEAQHQFNTDLRAGARILSKDHKDQIVGELQKFAQRIIPDFNLLLAERCNAGGTKAAGDKQDPMQICLGPESLWMDFVSASAVRVPESADSVPSFVCSAGCTLGKALSRETAKVIEFLNSQMQGLEIDEAMLSEISCMPTLPEGRTCQARCS